MRSLSAFLLACATKDAPGIGADTTLDSGLPEDSVADTSATTPAADLDADGWTAEGGDCDDTRADVHPGAEEWCDERDWDCDGNPLAPGICGLTQDVGVAGAALTTPGNSATVWPAGDLDGDSLPDLLAHEFNAGPPAPDGLRGPAWLLATVLDEGALDYPDGLHAWFSQPAGALEAETGGRYGDVDGDGWEDAGMALDVPNAIHLHLGPVATGGRWADDGEARWSSTPRGENGHWGYPLVAGGDLDGDGRADAVVGVLSDSEVFAADVFLGGTFGDDSEVARVYSAERVGGDGAILDDIDGDGISEVYLGDVVHHVVSGALLVTGDGATLDDLSMLRFPETQDGTWSDYSGDALTPGDWTGDGVPDILVGQPAASPVVPEGGVALWFDGTVRGSQGPEDALGSWASPVAAARTAVSGRLDFDGDTQSDIVLISGGLWVLVPHARGLPGPFEEVDGLRLDGRQGAIAAHPGIDIDADADDELLFDEHLDRLYIGYLDGWAVPWDEPEWW